MLPFVRISPLFMCLLAVLIASPLAAQNTPCEEVPPSGQAPDGCPWVSVMVIDNWEGPIKTTVKKKTINIYHKEFKYCTEPIIYPCNSTWPVLERGEIREMEKSNRYEISGGAGGEINIGGLVSRLIADANANVNFNGEWTNENAVTITYGFKFNQAACSWLIIDQVIEEWTAEGSQRIAGKRVTGAAPARVGMLPIPTVMT